MSERRCYQCGTPLTFHTYSEADAEFIGSPVAWVDAQGQRSYEDGHRHAPRIDWRAIRESEESKEEFMRMVERQRRVPGWIYR